MAGLWNIMAEKSGEKKVLSFSLQAFLPLLALMALIGQTACSIHPREEQLFPPTPSTNQQPIEPKLQATDQEIQQKFMEAMGKRNARVHDPSDILKCDGEYWFFCTGRGLSAWHSKDLIHWERSPSVLPNKPKWVEERFPELRDYWAPDVIFHNGRYLLYYCASVFGKRISGIGLLSSPTLNPADPNYHWREEGVVIQTDEKSNFNAIDPAIIRTDDGKLWMTFGSFWSGIKLIELDPKTGLRLAADSPIYSLANNPQIEAPRLYEHDGYYYMFLNWGFACRGVDSTYNIRVGRSKDITGPYLDKEGKDMLKGGGTLLLETNGPFIGPGHTNILFENGEYLFSCHYYDGTDRGRSWLATRKLFWGNDGWPELESTPTYAEFMAQYQPANSIP